MARVDKHVFARQDLERLWLLRWQARMDRVWFANEVLGYPDLNHKVHGPIEKYLMKFPGPKTSAEARESDKILDSGRFAYTPWTDPYKLEGSRRALILDHRSSMKCLTPGTLLSLADGRYKPVEELELGDILKSLTPEYGYTTTTVTGIEIQKPQPCVQVWLRSGRILEVSSNHPIKQLDTWTLAENLKPGDRVAVLNTSSKISGERLPFAEIVGWMLGDGYCFGQSVTNHTPALQQKIIEAAIRSGGTAHVTNEVTVRLQKLRPLFQGLGLLHCTSGDKFIPRVFFSADRQSTSELLYGLYMADGTMNNEGISYTSKSHRLIRDIQRLLVQFGIRSRVEKSTIRRGRYAGNVYWNLKVNSAPMVEKFLTLFSWDKPHSRDIYPRSQDSSDTVPKVWRESYGKYLFKHGTKPEFVNCKTNSSLRKYDITKNKLSYYAEALDSPKLRNLCSDDLFWDFVVEVKPLGNLITYGVETADHILVCDDVVTHNTHFNTIVDTLYWIINFPHLCFATIFSTGDKAADVIKNSLEWHFKFNRNFRELFPELCPTTRINDWGTAESFTVCGREDIMHRLKKPPRPEPTVRSLSLDKTGTGYHFDVIKCSDIVEPTNVRTPGERDQVKNRVGLLPKLLVVPEGWLYLEGTFYHPADLYSDLVKDWKAKTPETRNWDIFIRSAFKRKWPFKRADGTIQTEATLTPEDLDNHSWELDADGHECPMWPERFTWKVLDRIRRDPVEGGINFAAQYLLDLSADDSGEKPFPAPPNFVSRAAFERVPKAYRITTVDLADTTGVRSNYSVITTAAFDRNGRCYVEDIRRGKFQPDQIINQIFDVNEKFRPVKIFIEEYGFVSGLRPSIERRQALTNTYPPFHYHKRDRKANDKAMRIIRTLQTPFSNGDLRFVEPLDPASTQSSKNLRDAVEAEFAECTVASTGNSDDILDTVADLFLCRDYFGEEGLKGGILVQEAAARAEMQLDQIRTETKKMIFGEPERFTPDGFAW